MIYKNKDRVDTICKEIDNHMEKLNDLCEVTTVKIVDKPKTWDVLTISVESNTTDEYAGQGVALINAIKVDLKRKIADLHTELKKL